MEAWIYSPTSRSTSPARAPQVVWGWPGEGVERTWFWTRHQQSRRGTSPSAEACPSPVRESALPACGFAGGGKAETQNNQGVPSSTAADADCMGSGRSLQGILAVAGEYAAGGEAEAGQGRGDSA